MKKNFLEDFTTDYECNINATENEAKNDANEHRYKTDLHHHKKRLNARYRLTAPVIMGSILFLARLNLVPFQWCYSYYFAVMNEKLCDNSFESRCRKVLFIASIV